MTQVVRRRQATLFLNEPGFVETIRRRFNPEQAKLIAAHVTLCREDEVSDWEELARRLCELKPKAVTLNFRELRRSGDLVTLACVETADFDRLRHVLLNAPRKHDPHITLIHPRKGTCSDVTFNAITSEFQPFTHTFNEVSFIEQVDGGVWTVLDTFPLA